MKFNIKCIVSSVETNGRLAAFEEIVAPQSGPPLHAHVNQLEVFHIIDGTFLFQLDGEKVELGAGGCIAIPPKAGHAFKNIGETPGRIHFEFLEAGKSEAFFERLVKEGAQIEDMGAFFAEHEIELMGPPL